MHRLGTQRPVTIGEAPRGGEADDPVNQERLRQVGEAFGVEGSFQEARRLGSGHIHDTFLACYAGPSGPLRVVHQRLDTGIFRDPEAVMENLLRITEHLREKVGERDLPDPDRRVLRVIPARRGGFLYRDTGGCVWRSLRFVERTRSVDAIESAEQAFRAARAFGAFAAMLGDLPPPPLHVTIPHFHDLERRLEAFEAAHRADVVGRAAAVASEVAALRSQAREVQGSLRAVNAPALPRRVFHHDCKLNNLLLDEVSGEALCVIDLDTTMSGTVLSDFGELVRTGACRAAEDEADLDRVRLDLDLFEALARGYLAGSAGLLTEAEAERGALVTAGPMLTLMNAVRFLADHLSGDLYFRVLREGHNLDRARVQLRLAEQMRAAQPDLRVSLERATRAA
jgi:Ser/Thr protein kinase RdoA (MazF antagonist)